MSHVDSAKMIEHRSFDGNDVDIFQLTEEEEIAKRVDEEMKTVLAGLGKAGAASSLGIRKDLDPRQLINGFNHASSETKSASSSAWSEPSIVSAKLKAPSSSSSIGKMVMAMGQYDSRYTASTDAVDEAEELKKRQEVDDKVKRRAQELFAKMQKEDEDRELKLIEDEINKRVGEEARKKAERLLRDEEANERAKIQAEVDAQRAFQEATTRRIDEEVRKRVEEEVRRIKEMMIQASVKNGHRSTGSRNHLTPIEEDDEGDDTNNSSFGSDGESTCEIWAPLAPIPLQPLHMSARRGTNLSVVPRGSQHYHQQQQQQQLLQQHYQHQQTSLDYINSMQSKMISQGEYETKDGHDGYQFGSELESSGENKNESDGDHATIQQRPSTSGTASTLSMTPAEIERMIAVEVERRIAARDASARVTQVEATATSASISSAMEKRDWSSQSSLGMLRGLRSASDDDSVHNSSPSTLRLRSDAVVVCQGGAHSVQQKHRSNSLGWEPESTPLNLRQNTSRSSSSLSSSSSSSPSTSGPAEHRGEHGSPRRTLALPSPRAKTAFTPERARAASAAAQLGPLPDAALQLPLGLRAPCMPAEEVSEIEFLDATFSGQKYAGLEIASHRMLYTVMEGDAPAGGGLTRAVDCCVVNMTSLKAQIQPGDILVSVNDWPLINLPTGAGIGHFQMCMRLLHLAAPPRRIRFMRSKAAFAALSGLSDIPILKLCADDALLVYDQLNMEDFVALTADVGVAAAAEGAMALASAAEQDAQLARKTADCGLAEKGSVKSTSTEDETGTPLSLVVAVSMPSAAGPVKPPAPPAFPYDDGADERLECSSGMRDREQQRSDLYSEVDCAASALTTNTGAQQGFGLGQGAGPHHPLGTGATPSDQPNAHSSHSSQHTSQSAGNAPKKQRVRGFLKAVGRAIGLRRSAKTARRSGEDSVSDSACGSDPPSAQPTHLAGSRTVQASEWPLPVRPSMLPAATPSLPAPAAATVQFKSYPNPGSLGMKLAYHNLMFTDHRGALRSINCLVIGGFAKGTSETPELVREGDVLLSVNSNAIIANHDTTPTPATTPHGSSSSDLSLDADAVQDTEHDENDVADAQQFFQQAVTILGQAGTPRVIKFFRLPDARTMTGGRVFTVLNAAEAAVLGPHLTTLMATPTLQ